MINKTYGTRTHEPCVPTNQIDANFDTPSTTNPVYLMAYGRMGCVSLRRNTQSHFYRGMWVAVTGVWRKRVAMLPKRVAFSVVR